MSIIVSQNSYPPFLGHKPVKSKPAEFTRSNYSRSKSDVFSDDIRSKSSDEYDNPPQEKLTSDEILFKIMKQELNRLNSYTGRWPVSYIKPALLAENGFFYLQSEDKVQCAFCHVVIDDWNVGQKPKREHMRKSPKCPFLLHFKVGNVPLPPQSTEPVSKVNPVGRPSEINFSTYKPEHPRMADIKRRLLTYKDWPLIMLNSQQLAECGLFYTGCPETGKKGVSDVVTCFFCGGSLGNWDRTDDPFEEHTKYFPNCSYLRLVKGHRGSRETPVLQCAQMPTVPHQVRPSVFTSTATSNFLANEAIRQASEIFSTKLVQKVVAQHLREGGSQFNSLNDLCDAILEYKEQEDSRVSQDVVGHTHDVVCSDPPAKVFESVETPVVSNNEEPNVKNTKEVKDALLCKICMDQEMGVTFQPCGHLISCPKCAQMIFNCPLCRAPVTSKMRTYPG